MCAYRNKGNSGFVFSVFKIKVLWILLAVSSVFSSAVSAGIAEYRIPVSLTKAEAWEKLQDFSAASNYVPGVTAIDIITEKKNGVGAVRIVHHVFNMVETILEWNEGDGLLISVEPTQGEGPMSPFSAFTFQYTLEEENSQTYLHNYIHYDVGYGWLGDLINSLFLGAILNSQIKDITIAQKLFYETGRPTTADALKAAKKSLVQ